jgi:glycosyltransferase involved in cell wall biosynthesis
LIADGTPNRGLAGRLNQGVGLARGRYIARMDGDDVSFPQRFERQVQFLSQHPEVDLLGCGMVIFNDSGRLIGVQRARLTHPEICGNLMHSCLLPHATWMGPADWFRRNRYDERNRRAEDRDLLLRTHRTSRFAGLSDILYGYRVNGVSIRRNARARMDYLRAVSRDARRHGEWARLCAASLLEIAKLGYDTFALVSRAERWLLRHRARGTDDPALQALWASRWDEIADSEGLVSA